MLGGVAIGMLLAATGSGVTAVDAAASNFEFSAPRKMGSPIRGVFGRADGRLQARADGQRKVKLVLNADSIKVSGNPWYSKVARGPLMFNAKEFPTVEFNSDWHSPAILRSGGNVTGTVTLLGVTRRETFAVMPSKCERPGVDCPIIASGRISRERYGMRGLSAVLRGDVELSMSVRFDAPEI